MKLSFIKINIFGLVLVIITSICCLSCTQNNDSQKIDYQRLKCTRNQLETRLLNDIWGNSLDNVFVVGEKGAIYQYNGNSWKKTDSPTSVNINGIWGTSSSNVFTVTDEGEIFRYDSKSWTPIATYNKKPLVSIWGSSENDIWAVGYNGFMVHYDGNSWEIVESNTTEHLLDIWGSSSQDIYAVGGKETIIHYDGKKWSPITTNKENRYMYTGIWGFSQDNVLVAGNSPKANLIRFNVNSWNPVVIDNSHILTHISGSSDSNIFAAGSNGYVIHFDGKAWHDVGDVEKNFNDAYTYVWTYSITDTFIIGIDGVILHYSYAQ